MPIFDTNRISGEQGLPATFCQLDDSRKTADELMTIYTCGLLAPLDATDDIPNGQTRHIDPSLWRDHGAPFQTQGRTYRD